MSLVYDCAVAFFGGAFYETACVFWVHNSERGLSKRAASWSAFAAMCQLLGFDAQIGKPLVALFVVLGFYMGTYVSIEFKKKQR
jgi:hypothetical protein